MEGLQRHMSAASKQKVFEELRDLISDQLKAVTFKWLARHLSMPANDAKRLLFEFSEKHRSKVSSTYLIAGWTKAAVPQHSVQLIDASDVADKRSKLDPVTSLHVYSIRPSAPKGPSDIFNYDELQTKELFLGMVKRGEENCLSDNRWSAVQCQGAKRNPGMAQASKSAMPVAPTEEKPASAVAAAIKDAAEGKMPLKAAGADKPAGREADAEHDSAPAKATEQPAAKPAAAKGKGSAIASMWSKAPPKKAGKAPPKQTPAPAAAKSKAAAVDAEAYLRLNQQDEASSSGEEDEKADAPIRRTQRPARANALADSDDDRGDAPSAKPSAEPSAPAAEAKPANKQQRKRKTVLDEDSDSDEDWDAPKRGSDADAAVRVTTSEPVKAEATADAEAVEAEKEPASEKNPKKARKTSASTKRSAPGTVKLHNSATGPVRKRVQRTAYNEKGEEVTEMVSEDEEPQKSAAKADKQGAEPAAEEKPKQVAQPPAAAASRSESNGGVKRKAGAGVDSKPAKKPASKSKASMSAGQRNIKSFFVKK